MNDKELHRHKCLCSGTNTLKKILFCGLVVLLLLLLCSCGAVYEWHGIDEYIYEGGTKTVYGNSNVDVDDFFASDDTSFFSEFKCIDCDYHYVDRNDFLRYNVCETAILYFEYDENTYKAAKAYCDSAFQTMGDEPSEKYGEYLFYDYYEKRDKTELYHLDAYPKAFKRVAFNDSEQTIVLIGIYTTDQRTTELAEDVKDWGAFLEKYFGEYYSF